jgi:YgiT-type zinc finger domain-containing protein
MGTKIRRFKMGKKFNEGVYCADCGGELEKKNITHIAEWQGEAFILENVPAKVCRRCGHVWFSSRVAEAIDRILAEKPKPSAVKEVPVYSMEDYLEEVGVE